MTLVYCKLGGSLLTDKRGVEEARLDVIERLAEEIAAARRAEPGLRLILGHGSGSFGHVHAKTHGTRTGVATPAQWYGFAATAHAAARLNRLVTGALLEVGIPAWTIQPSVALRCQDGVVTAGPEATVMEALAQGLVPVVHGDVALDTVRGGTIAGTEEVFAWLMPHLPPSRIILAGEVAGVYSGDPLADPAAARLAMITPAQFDAIRSGLGGSHGADVTGGMAAKVEQALQWVRDVPGLEVLICSGMTPGNLTAALVKPQAAQGTWLRA
jgi:isopentenyl phosphate kinase